MKEFKMKYRVKYGSGESVKNRLFLEEENARKWFYAMDSAIHNSDFVVKMYHWEQVGGRWDWIVVNP